MKTNIAATKNCTIDGPCCDPETKRYRPSYYTCRAAKSICDVAEYCTGIDSSCPADKVQVEKDSLLFFFIIFSF